MTSYQPSRKPLTQTFLREKESDEFNPETPDFNALSNDKKKQNKPEAPDFKALWNDREKKTEPEAPDFKALSNDRKNKLNLKLLA
mgnify:CR=1 FL=1